MPAIRVLIVDDSVVVRRLVGDAVSGEPGLVVAGIAADGLIALSRIPQVNPDVVILDVEMPNLDGLETLVEIRKTYPKLPVIMFSSLTERGATTTLEALTRGASDYVTKPTGASGPAAALEQVRAQLVPKILALCGNGSAGGASLAPPARARPSVVVGSPPRATAAAARLRAPVATAPPIDVVAIGSSTGGPNALADVLCALPESFPVPIVITQHMPPMFTRLLAERLDSKCALTVREAEAGAVVAPGTVLIAPGDHHMVFGRDGRDVWVILNQDPPENACRPAVDVMFRSVVSVYGRGVLGVILTGMGQDGLRGSELVRESGGSVFAQDEESSVVWGMPGFVTRSGLANRVIALPAMATAIQAAVVGSRRPATLQRGGNVNAD
jgi:two-component system, chemotaxis family, protein-glutamate methylesterase/glutaminase